eukprot:tig00000241_g21028.t1
MTSSSFRHSYELPPGAERGILSPSELLHRRELVRVHELWQGTKDELREVKSRLSDIERNRKEAHALRERQHAEEIQTLQMALLEAKDRGRYLEIQLSSSRSERERAERETASLALRLQEAEHALSEKNLLCEKLTQQVRALGTQVDEVERLREEFAARSGEELRRQLESLSHKERRLAELEERAAGLYAETSEWRELAAKHEARAAALQQRADGLEGQNRELKGAIDAARGDIARLDEMRRTEADLREQAESLKRDCGRLMQLLGSTAEYGSLVEALEDAGGTAHFVAPQPGASLAGVPHRPLDAEEGPRGREEGGRWVPGEVRALLLEARRLHAPGLPAALVDELLLRIHAVYRAREARRVARLRKRYNEQLADLRRQLSQRVPYRDVVKLAEFERVRNSLQASGKARAAPSTGKQRAAESEERLLQTTMQTVDDLTRQVSEFAEENRALRERLTAATHRHEDQHFLDGAAWFGSRAVDYIDRSRDAVEVVTREYREKLLQASRDDPSAFLRIAKIQSAFLEDLTRRVTLGRERVRHLFERVLGALEEGQPLPRVGLDGDSDA